MKISSSFQADHSTFLKLCSGSQYCTVIVSSQQVGEVKSQGRMMGKNFSHWHNLQLIPFSAVYSISPSSIPSCELLQAATGANSASAVFSCVSWTMTPSTITDVAVSFHLPLISKTCVKISVTTIIPFSSIFMHNFTFFFFFLKESSEEEKRNILDIQIQILLPFTLHLLFNCLCTGLLIKAVRTE